MVGRGLGGACGLVLCYVLGSCLGLCLLMLGGLIMGCTLMMVGGLVGRQRGRSRKEEVETIGSVGESLPLCLSWDEALDSVSPDKARNESEKESLGAGKCVLDGAT